MTLSADIEQGQVESLPVHATARRAGFRLPWIDALGVAALLAYALLLARPIFEGKGPIAADTLGRWSPWAKSAGAHVHNIALADSGLLFLPWETFTRNAFADGEWPMWDPTRF